MGSTSLRLAAVFSGIGPTYALPALDLGIAYGHMLSHAELSVEAFALSTLKAPYNSIPKESKSSMQMSLQSLCNTSPSLCI